MAENSKAAGSREQDGPGRPLTRDEITKMAQWSQTRALQVAPDLKDAPGIYFITRTDRHGIKHGYVGQSKAVLTRMGQHLLGHAQDIDMALRHRGLYDPDKNPTGYKVGMLEYPKEKLDAAEEYWVVRYAGEAYQMHNRTCGKQGKGKEMLGDKRPASDYARGIADGRQEMAAEFAEVVDALQSNPGDPYLWQRLRELASEGEENITFALED